MFFYLLNSYQFYFNNNYKFIYKNISRQIIQEFNGYYLLECFFSNLIGSNGGSISISSLNSNIVIEYCNFLLCLSNSNGGGAINLLNSNLVLNKVCGSNCYSTNNEYGQFLKSSLNINNLLILEDLNLNNFSKNLYNSLVLNYCIQGIQKHKNLNFSNIKIGFITGIFTHSNTNFSILYSNFINTNSDYILFDTANGLNNFTLTNIINNTQNTEFWGILLAEGGSNLFINNCYFKNNYKFIFYCRAGNILINNCFSDNFDYSGTAPTFQFTNEIIFTLNLNIYKFFKINFNFKKNSKFQFLILIKIFLI